MGRGGEGSGVEGGRGVGSSFVGEKKTKKGGGLYKFTFSLEFTASFLMDINPLGGLVGVGGAKAGLA